MAPPVSGDLRIVMLGVTGAGKSATGNTILGKDVFDVDCMNPDSVTKYTEKKMTRKDNRNILIIDTPGLQDPSAKENKVRAEIKRCMEISAPGPHVFLLVIRLDERFTEEKKNAVKWIQENFGEEAARYTIILFTHADQMKGKPLKERIEETPDLRQFVMSCGGRYHPINNEDRENQDQVNELLDKMDEMVLKNGGRHYTNEMFSEVQRGLNWRKTAGITVVVVVCGVAVVAVVVKKSKK